MDDSDDDDGSSRSCVTSGFVLNRLSISVRAKGFQSCLGGVAVAVGRVMTGVGDGM